jgi:hypothetical protein
VEILDFSATSSIFLHIHNFWPFLSRPPNI